MSRCCNVGKPKKKKKIKVAIGFSEFTEIDQKRQISVETLLN